MAGNRTNIRGRYVTGIPTDGGTNAGDPCLIGQIPAVSLNGGGAVAQVVDTEGVYALSVKGVVSGPANSAVNQGDIIYYNSGHTPKLDKDSGGVRYGYAVATQQKNAGATTDPQVASAATTTISVRLGY